MGSCRRSSVRSEAERPRGACVALLSILVFSCVSHTVSATLWIAFTSTFVLITMGFVTPQVRTGGGAAATTLGQTGEAHDAAMQRVHSMNDTLGGAFVQTDSGGRPRALAFAPGAGSVQRSQPRALPLRPSAARATPSPGARAAPPASSPAGRQRAASPRSQPQNSPSTSTAAKRRKTAGGMGGLAAAASSQPRAAASGKSAKPGKLKRRGRGPVKPPPGWVAANPGKGPFRKLPLEERCAAVDEYEAARAAAPPKPRGGAGKKAKAVAEAAGMTRKLDLLFRAAAGEEAPQGEAPDLGAAALHLRPASARPPGIRPGRVRLEPNRGERPRLGQRRRLRVAVRATCRQPVVRA